MIDLRSDTVTRPSDRMREAARDAPVGDDVYREDPTVNELESRVAEVLGTESALLVPSGTMGNQIAGRVHTERGQEVLCERESHVYKWELAGLAQHAEVQPRTIDGGDRGVIDPDQVREGYVEADGHRPGTGLLAMENTHNSKGGTAIAPERIAAAAEAAHDLGVSVHLDGAPVGSMLARPEETIEKARRVRKLLGGGMRQAGILAAPGLEALENRDRLREDHDRAERLAAGLDRIGGLRVDPPETNIVLVHTDRPAEAVLDDCEQEGVLGVPFAENTIRFCTHWDVSDDDIDDAIDAVERAV